MDVPVSKIRKKQMNKILKGSGRTKIHFYYVNEFGRVHDNMIQFEGVLHNIARRYRESSSDYIRDTLERYMSQTDCPTSSDYRLNEQALSVKTDTPHMGEV